MNRINKLIAIALMVALAMGTMGLVGCGRLLPGVDTEYEPEVDTSQVDRERSPTAEDLQLISHNMTTRDLGGNRTYIVNGTVKNISSVNIDYAEIEVEFLTADGTYGGSISWVEDLAPGETGDFEGLIVLYGFADGDWEAVTDYKIRVVYIE